MIRRQQKRKEHQKTMEEWKIKYALQQKANHWRKDKALVVVAPETVQWALKEIYHDGKTAGHPRQAKTYQGLARDYWWPSMRHFVSEYVKGCAVCQANKIVTHRNNPPLQPIKPEEGVAPFQTIAMDFIVKLPQSGGYDALWTITDHDCTKVVILIPCKEEITSEELAILYKDRVFPWIGLPNKVISNRDPRFTSNLMTELCQKLEIKQAISTAYHPQTDGQSEKTNQHVETALRIFCNFQQNDWADHIPIVQYMLNSHVSETTKKAPYELWMGHIPRAHQPISDWNLPRIDWYQEKAVEARRATQEAMERAQRVWVKDKPFKPYLKGDKVWLEAKNLKTTHPTTKLRPLRYGLFEIVEALSQVTYRLQLPEQWQIHNVFHASLLHPYKEMEEHGPNFPEPSPDLIEGKQEWEVDQVLASRRYGRKKALQYLLKWKGFSEAHNSWQNAKDMRAP